jgi:asparagine synthase (glutamine-hydrolysing)
MTVNLETRVLMLGHRLVEFAMSLPLGILRAERQTKWPLQQQLYKICSKGSGRAPQNGLRRAD